MRAAYRCIAVAAVLSCAACNTQVNRIKVDPQRLHTPASRQAPAALRLPALACAYRLKDVVDARPAGDHSGGLGRHQLTIEDVPALVRSQLLQAGLRPAEADGGAEVRIEIKQLYLTQNQVSKIPVAVYRARVGDQAPFVLRAQQANMNWNSSENEAYDALARALQDVNVRLLIALNERCGGRT